MGLVIAGGLRWNVESWGDRTSAAAPLLLLHGFSGCGRSWNNLSERFAASRFCLAPDLPGHGGTEAPPEGFDVERLADALSDLLDELGVRRACVLGYSMGGRLALHLAARRPAKVERLVLVGASPGIEDPCERSSRAASDEAWARLLEGEGVSAFVEAWMSQPIFSSRASLAPERLDALRQEKLAQSAGGLAAAMRAFGAGKQKPLHDALPGISVPVLLVAGEKDGKYCRICEEMAARLPDGRVTIIEGAGHAPQTEEPERFLAAVAAFLDAAATKE
jgi:2-succinyl-6-hydroxy-2,4-cyclohexadiene-1-carboxylate synthase